MSGRFVMGAMALAIALPARAGAQSVAQRIADAPDGVLTMRYAAREGVCGDGNSLHISMYGDEEDPGPRGCQRGPVHVRLTLARGRVTDVESKVGGNGWSTSHVALGAVPAAEAARALLGIARTAEAQPARDAIQALALADSVLVWPDLLELARDRSRPTEPRGAALFWVGQEAGARVTSEMVQFVEDSSEDRELRQMAVFALSRHPADQSVPVLIRVARTDRDPELRRHAIFFLGRTGDPRAIDFFEEVLTR
ncbi:MAG TPA: HEAT repeat domain-containing protein [Gemmatimonadales bacterium]|nr:HEAT repeat domain-containing protein [Gemmatimonadales bacterium]